MTNNKIINYMQSDESGKIPGKNIKYVFGI